MAISKNRPKHKEHKKTVNNLKTKTKKKMNENQTTQTANQVMPPVRSVPVWSPEADILVKGFEWEAIQNGLANLSYAMNAGQSIMSRNILSGVITMDFQKLDASGTDYEAMTAEEKAPHLEQFQAQIDAFKQAQVAAKIASEKNIALAEKDTLVNSATEVSNETNAEQETGGKIITFS
jgi:hypothetical protein